MKTYKDLDVWKISCDLVVEVYKLTKKFPAEEKYGLVSQMKRSAISIPSNIAEGFNRRSMADNKNFIKIAFGSGAELETQIYLAAKLNFCQNKDLVVINELLLRTMQMLNKLARSLSNN